MRLAIVLGTRPEIIKMAPVILDGGIDILSFFIMFMSNGLDHKHLRKILSI
jgi:UDP-N-acetylglucosamine 2-epimerase